MIQQIGIVGAGVMGAEIAQAAAAAGFDVRLLDADADALSRGLAHVGAICERRVARGRMSPEDAAAIVARVRPARAVAELSDCGLAIEAITERIEPKRSVFRDLDGALPEEAILASNTSGLSIAELGRQTGRPGQVVGMHFFNPASVMRLVEVVRSPDSAEETVATIVDVARRMGKEPVVVRECPGFLVNRVLCRALAEAYRAAAASGAGRVAVDASVVATGPAPMGPYALGDLVGLDTLAHVISDLTSAYGGRFSDAGACAAEVAAGRLGAKSGGGFYEGRAPEGDTDDAGRAVAERYYLGAFDEACRCIDEGVADLGDVDAAIRLGCGWSEGPLRWADDQGLAAIATRLEALADGDLTPREPLTSRLQAGTSLATDTPS